MTDNASPVTAPNHGPDYRAALAAFDAAVCEACAVSQAIGVRQAEPHAGYAAIFFTRVCAHATSMIRALPHSRWVRSNDPHWDFGAVAGHARALLEGHLTFTYLSATPESQEEWSAKLNVMHLCDCARRISLFANLGEEASVKGFEGQKTELQNRLAGNAWFLALPEAVRKQCLNGKYLHISNRDALVKETGGAPKAFNAWFDVLSQHTHILTMSFYRMEPDGRGTGVENDTDRGYMTMAMENCTAILQEEVDRLVELFPDTAQARQGVRSRFSPGPKENWPDWRVAQERAFQTRRKPKSRRRK
ncbi:hypothetical protein [Luteibacter sp. 9135]|uniref:hypothetical protein n=1 Tax=Luteibacter sp. 9135 TaxID=1500893 RepID=UPI00068E8191|nr:hypothetical protein [Luteibacter sp. 9135]